MAATDSVPRRLCTPLDQPIDELALRVSAWRAPALLRSGPGFGDAGRYSVLAAEPRFIFEAMGSETIIKGELGARVRGLLAKHRGALEQLADLLEVFELARPFEEPDPQSPPFQGGMIGLLGYDLAPSIENLPRGHQRDSRVPDIHAGLYDTYIIIDHRSKQAELCAIDLLGEGSRALGERLAVWRNRLGEPRPEQKAAREFAGELVSNFSEQAYRATVDRILEYIAAGDVFQVNLAQRFRAEVAVDPFALHTRLGELSPAPFSAYLAGRDWALATASPEWFYQTRGDRIVTRPIKGTRPRGVDPASDALLARELAASVKDRAELAMIVDLERNDLGKICTYGSVRVTDPVRVESFAQVHHLVATVEGRLRPGTGPIEIVRALFPGGSITGAPKIRAMQIIDELEPCRRGVYTGAVGYWSRGGGSAFNIAIRTIVVEPNAVSYHVGGGIVADSDPSLEYQETLQKGQALRQALLDLGAIR